MLENAFKSQDVTYYSVLLPSQLVWSSLPHVLISATSPPDMANVRQAKPLVLPDPRALYPARFMMFPISFLSECSTIPR